MTSPLFIDEPLIVPPTTGEAVLRLSRLIGHLNGESSRHIDSLRAARTELIGALETGDQSAIGSTLLLAQQKLLNVYESVREDDAQCIALGFPTQSFMRDEMAIAPVDIETVTATFTLIGKQILTSLAFARAANATSYWLHEVRHFQDAPEERVEDAVIEKSAPLFDRLRLPSGPRVLRIKSRNLSAWVLSEEFTIDVPHLSVL